MSGRFGNTIPMAVVEMPNDRAQLLALAEHIAQEWFPPALLKGNHPLLFLLLLPTLLMVKLRFSVCTFAP